MSTELRTPYLEARRRFEEAAGRARELAVIVSDVAKGLAGNARVEPHPPGMDVMDNAIPPAGVVWFDPLRWPTADVLMEVLDGLRLAAKETRITWNQIPATFRSGLMQPPPEASI